MTDRKLEYVIYGKGGSGKNSQCDDGQKQSEKFSLVFGKYFFLLDIQENKEELSRVLKENEN